MLKTTRKTRLYLTAAALTSQALALLLACSVVAQDATAAKELKPTVVTGTYLESADAAGTLTVTPVELTEPINQGYSTVADVLRTKLPQYGGPGALNPGVGNGGDGNSYVSLRGLPGNATLVLVNGRRTSLSALNLIPDAAVEKIEILNDGGGATYGSDAVAGVVNVILRKNFQGTKVSASYGFTTQTPNVNEKKFQILAGDTTEKANFVISAEYSGSDELRSPDRSPSDQSRGLSATSNPGTIVNRTKFATHTVGEENVPDYVGLNWHVNPAVVKGGLTSPTQVAGAVANGFNPVYAVDTRSATSIDQAVQMAADAQAALNNQLGANSPVLYGNAPPFPYPLYTTLYRPHQKYDFSGSGEYKLIDDKVKFFADAYYVNYRSQLELAPSPLSGANGLVIPVNQNYWMTNVFPGTYPAGSALRENYRMVELGPRVYTDEFEDFRFVGGLRGEIPDTTWKWELGFLYTRGEQFEVASGGVVLSKLADLLNRSDPSAWNPFGVTPPFGKTTINDVGPLADTANVRWLTINQGIDFNTSGEVVDLPGGPLKVALGFVNRRESFDQSPDLASKEALIAPFNQVPAYGAVRTIWGGFGEMLVPITGKDFNIPGFAEFNVSAALRYEDYDDVGDTGIKPRVSGRWKPLEGQEFAVRGSYAEGFTAPSFGQLYSPPAQDFIEVLNPYTGVRAQPFDGEAEIGNPNLKPTKSETWLVGGEYSPKALKNFTFGVDYYRIEQEGIPVRNPDYIIGQWYKAGGFGAGDANPWGANAGRSAANPLGTQVDYDPVSQQFNEIRNLGYINTGRRFTDGIDLQLSHAIETDLGTFTVSGLATRVLSFEQENFPGDKAVDYLGRYWGSDAALADTGYPEWRANFTLAYNYKRVNAAVGVNYIDGYVENVPPDRSVDPWVTVDLRFGVKIPYIEADFLVGVNNLLDTEPPTVYSSFENNFDRTIADPRGRMIYLSLSKQF